MKIFATFDDSGLPTGFYIEGVTEPPEGAVEITEAQHSEFMAHQAARRWQDGAVVSYEPPAPPVDLPAYAADARWRREVGGTTVLGIPILTDDRAKLLITGSRVAAMANPAWETIWYAADGSTHPVDSPTMIAISDAVAAHVAACFAAYGTVAAGIEAGTITTTQQIDDAFAAL